MARLLLIADDFTGALDTGVQFARQNIGTQLRSGEEAVRPQPPPGDPTAIWVIDTQSRHLSPRDASRKIEAAAAWGLQGNIRLFYKKTDSTLRGNVGAELSALLRATAAPRLLFVPAWPAMGRTTHAGRQHVEGAPLERSAFASAPLEPTPESSVAALLARQTSTPVQIIPETAALDDVLADDMRRGILVFDAQSEERLLEIGVAARRCGKDRLFAGCAGFAAALARTMDFARQEATPSRRPSGGAMLIVCGSLSERSRGQAAVMEQAGVPAVVPSPPSGPFETRQTAQRLAAHLSRAGRALLRTAGAGSPIPSCEDPAPAGAGDRDSPRAAIARGLGQIVAETLRQTPVSWLVIFGGDTARAVVDALGAPGLKIRDEVTPGVVYSEVEWPDGPLGLITKAGGFGAMDVWRDIERFAQRPPAETVTP